jgi:hypothetical protein
MTKAKIRCSAKVRELLIELDAAFEKFGQQAKVLADHSTDGSTAVNVGLDKQIQERIIVGIAWRINKASKGIE